MSSLVGGGSPSFWAYQTICSFSPSLAYRSTDAGHLPHLHAQKIIIISGKPTTDDGALCHWYLACYLLQYMPCAPMSEQWRTFLDTHCLMECLAGTYNVETTLNYEYMYIGMVPPSTTQPCSVQPGNKSSQYQVSYIYGVCNLTWCNGVAFLYVSWESFGKFSWNRSGLELSFRFRPMQLIVRSKA